MPSVFSILPFLGEGSSDSEICRRKKFEEEDKVLYKGKKRKKEDSGIHKGHTLGCGRIHVRKERASVMQKIKENNKKCFPLHVLFFFFF